MCAGSNKVKIAILIPCYNEALTIGSVVEECRKHIPEAAIYVYDNNSIDGTSGVALAAGAIVRRERRQGKGNVVRSMFRQIDADCYLMLDGDGTYDLTQAAEMCRLVLEEEIDMVIGDRLSESYQHTHYRPFHSFGNALMCRIINLIFRSDVRDIMTGLRAMSRRFVKNCPVMSDGFQVETEMTIFALDRKLSIAQIPVVYRDRPEGSYSKLNTYTDGARVLGMVVRLFRDYKPLTFFGLLALLLLICATGLFVPVFLEYLSTGLVPRFPTLIVSGFMVLASFVLFVCGMVLHVIVSRHRQLAELLLKQ